MSHRGNLATTQSHHPKRAQPRFFGTLRPLRSPLLGCRRVGGRGCSAQSFSGRWCEGRQKTVILPKARDPRFITLRRGGTLKDSHHRLLAQWAAECAEHVLPIFEAVEPLDPRPRRAVEQARAWTRGEITMTQARPMPQPESCPELRDTRHTPLARPGRSPTLQPTNSVLPPTRSRQRGLLLRRARGIVLVGASATGSVSGCRRRFAILCWMTSGCATGSVGRCSIASGPVARRR